MAYERALQNGDARGRGILALMGRAARAVPNLSRARRIYSQLIKSDPRDPYWYGALARVEEELGERLIARHHYCKAVQLGVERLDMRADARLKLENSIRAWRASARALGANVDPE